VAAQPPRAIAILPTTPPVRPSPVVEVALTIVVPGLVLMQLGDALGTAGALALALAFPVAWGVWDGWRRRKLNWLSVIGIVSTLLTGGVALLRLDAEWFAIKEGALPALMGLVIAASAGTRHPLIHALVFDAALLDVERIAHALAARGNAAAFEVRLRQGTLLLAAVFLASAAASYALARGIVTSAPGTDDFNRELGRLTLLSYPLVALPTMLAMMALLYWLAAAARRLTGLALGDMLGGRH
jgi:hypothetical protein